MGEFFEKNLNKILGSAGILGVFQFLGQISDYLADGKLDHHEIQQLFLTATSAAQTAIIIAVVIYFKFWKKDKE